MIEIIIYTLALVLFQLWLLPASTRLDKLDWLLSSRDQPLDVSVIQGRIQRAGSNLQESLAPFLALAIIAHIQKAPLETVAWMWLAARVVYIPCYLLNVKYIRSLVWSVSLGALICMAYRLI
ncbi:MAG: MAPEG family protein [Halieaceae bacterium]|nr:MAPEG family protein [Halieaceae bacterium]